MQQLKKVFERSVSKEFLVSKILILFQTIMQMISLKTETLKGETN